MILLPLFCIGIAEGLGFLGSYLQGPLRLKTLFPIHFTAALLVALSFFAYFPSVLAERRDPIDEPEILEAIKEYEVDYVFQIGPVRTLHAVENYMRSNFYREGKPYFRVAWISRTDPFNPVKARELAAFLIGNKIIPPAATHDISLGVIYSNEKASGPEFEFSSRTSDEPNTFYMNIIDYYAVPRGNPEGVVLPPEVVRL